MNISKRSKKLFEQKSIFFQFSHKIILLVGAAFLLSFDKVFKKNGKIVLGFGLFLFLVTILIIPQGGCQYHNTAVPESKIMTGKIKKFKEKNQFSFQHLVLTIPQNWNYLAEANRGLLSSFVSQKANIKGELYAYQNSENKDIAGLFQSYIKTKTRIRFLWMSPVKNKKVQGWVAKGAYDLMEEIFAEKRDFYHVYVALYKYEGQVYELILLAKGEEKDIEAKALRIINNVRFVKESKPKTWKRFRVKISELPAWNINSTKGKQIISWNHQSEPVIFILSQVKKLAKSVTFKTEVRKAISRFRIHLLEINYKYDYQIKVEKIGRKRAVVFKAVGALDNKRVGIRKYYFKSKQFIYEAEIWYSKKDWDDGIGAIVNELMKTIGFTK